MRHWLARVRKSKLSTRVAVIFGAALILPWCIFAWLAVTERAEQLQRTKDTLAVLAAAHAQHAVTLMRLGIAVPADGATVELDPSRSTTQGEEEVAAFRAALNVPGVTLSLRRSDVREPSGAPGFTPTFEDRNGTLVAEVDSPGGISAAASMSKDEALKDWRARAYAGAIALVLRSLFVIGVGLFLVRQLRRREAVERELISAKEKAESASRAKSDFLANMSHELRTPLNAIIGFSEIIKRQTFGPTSERYPEYARDIFNSGTHLLALINDILNLSKLEAGQFALQDEAVDLAITVDACMQLMETQARQANVRLSVALDQERRWIRADERRLRQILINLLSNAVKFTPEGGDVRISSARKGGGLAISVSDTGIGMAPEDIPKAMAPFGQIESNVRRKQEGTGLGLPLAKQFVELHGGTFTIDSKIDVGTTVTFVLPKARIIAPPAHPTAARAAG